MNFDEWMCAEVNPLHQPTDDGMETRLLRQCWEADQAGYTADLDRPSRPCAWAHRYSPRGLLHTLRDNQQDAEDDAAIVGWSAHAVALYDEQALYAAVAAERERRHALATDFAEYLYRVTSQVPFEHTEWAQQRGAALLAALRA